MIKVGYLRFASIEGGKMSKYFIFRPSFTGTLSSYASKNSFRLFNVRTLPIKSFFANKMEVELLFKTFWKAELKT